MAIMNTGDFGIWAEGYVTKYLESKNYKILDKNYRKKWGEIDIITEKEGILVFIEVKASKVEAIGFEPERRVSPEKIKRLNRAIQTYLAYKKYSPEKEYQIDIVSLTLSVDKKTVKIKHFKNIDI